jgi:transcriptional regulator with XRE-family HTH domain
MARLPQLKTIRERGALTQEQLAQLASVSRTTIARIETGAPTFPTTTRKLAQALDVEPAELMKMDGEWRREQSSSGTLQCPVHFFQRQQLMRAEPRSACNLAPLPPVWRAEPDMPVDPCEACLLRVR